MRNVLLLLGLVAGVFVAPGALPAQTVEPTPLPPPIIVPPCPLDCWWPIIPVAQLDRLEIDASVRTASITARYTLRLSNPADWQAEGRIVVPVPPNSAVVDLALSDGSQTLEGKLLDADEAQRIYDEIVARRIDPALLRSLEDDLYEVRAFPVPPGEQREVRFTVVTPLTTIGDQVDVQVPWSRMSPRPATALVTVDIDVPWEVRGVIAPGFPLETVRSGSGQVVVNWESPAKWLAGADFHLYITGGADLLATRLLAYRLPSQDGYFALLFAPVVETDAQVARDVVLVLDTSGSMEGAKLAQAQAAATDILTRLGAEDRFGIVAFASQIRLFDSVPRPAAERDAGIAFIDGLSAGGGTNIAGALEQAFNLASGDRPATIVFLTDGLPTVGLESPAAIRDRLEQIAAERLQLFAFGVGYDVNTLLLDSLTTRFVGSSHYVTPDEAIDAEVARLYTRIASPVLTDVTVSIAGGETYALTPAALRGIFAGELALLTGRYAAPGAAIVTVSGNGAAGPATFTYEVAFPALDGADPTVAQLWAQRRIADLLTELRIEGPRDSLIEEIVAIATQFGIVTPYTAYLAEEPDLVFAPEAGADAVAESTASAPATGAEAVEGASDLEALREGSLALGAESVRVVGTHSFYPVDGTWVQEGYVPGTPAPALAVTSPDFAALAAVEPELAAAAALGPRVIAETHSGWVTVTWPLVTTGRGEVALYPGWNLVGATAQASVVDATASVAGRFRNLFVWDPASQSFRSYAPDLPASVNTATELRPGAGLWIFVTDPIGAVWTQPEVAEARTVEVAAGFNLVAWTGPDGTPVAEALAGIIENVAALYTFDAAAQQFRAYRPDVPETFNSAATLDYGSGLWLEMHGPATWQQAAPLGTVGGLVTLGPLCPVLREDEPCPDQPYQATLVVQDATGVEVARTMSGLDGRYRVVLEPGTYTIVPLSPLDNILPVASPVQVTTVARRWTTVDIAYDTGIR